MTIPTPGRFLGPRSPSPRTRPTPPYRPRLEALEDRLLLSGSGAEPEGPVEGATDPLRVVTYNVDPGSHLAPLVAAATPQALPAAMDQVWTEVSMSNIPGRAVALAREIAQHATDVVGLQGAALWTVNGRVAYDFLGLLRRDLRAFGQHFIVAAAAPTPVVDLPDAAGNLIGCIDRTAILVNADMSGRAFSIHRPATGVYMDHSNLQIGGPHGMLLPSWGSWACVNLVNSQDADHTFRFVTTRMDSQDPSVAAEQVDELLAGPGQVHIQGVFAGDFGAPPGSLAYQEMFLQGGFYDTWLQRHALQSGFTSGEPSLSDPVRELQSRTDFVFIRVGLTIAAVEEIGTLPGEQAPTGLWPSDHAGLRNNLILI